jgi:integrase
MIGTLEIEEERTSAGPPWAPGRAPRTGAWAARTPRVAPDGVSLVREGPGELRPRPPAARLPVVLTRDEVRAMLACIDGVPRLMATLLYGSGLRRLECCRLRVKDVDFGRHQITVRSGKGDRDRAAMLPASVKIELAAHLERMRAQHGRDLAEGGGWVELPGSLAKKLPSAGREWPWQWVFPATRTYLERESGERGATTCSTTPATSARPRSSSATKTRPRR